MYSAGRREYRTILEHNKTNKKECPPSVIPAQVKLCRRTAEAKRGELNTGGQRTQEANTTTSARPLVETIVRKKRTRMVSCVILIPFLAERVM